MKKSILILTALLITSIGASAQVFRLPQYISEMDYEAGAIMLKVSSSLRNSCRVNGIENAQLAKALNTIGAIEVARKYPKHLQPSSERNGNGEPLVDLSLIYQVKFNSSYPIEKAINLLLATGMVDYAEPRYVPQLLYQPNDPDTASQYYLSLIRAYQAWDISKGDSIHVVGVTDTGTDLDHPDLSAGIKYNYADPINGVDDDNDGYVDNFMGWDVGSNDNDPSVDVVHGSFVCGLAGAVTRDGELPERPWGFKFGLASEDQIVFWRSDQNPLRFWQQ